ncbi:hypothetical protein KUCAC02_002512 [Chaenocephalus aceratus]|uniref:Uncharacterized protein n=1 Tax=Chaenocephalus aceratus TaxID=36190 RepID=A0ACB9XW08_CHAAC|nr:hypothetical protein KUCAC02_002512 [Chaenocephalus aceratus]
MDCERVIEERDCVLQADGGSDAVSDDWAPETGAIASLWQQAHTLALLLQPLPFQQQKGGVVSDCDQFKDISAAMTTMAMAAALCSVLLYEWAPAAAETLS